VELISNAGLVVQLVLLVLLYFSVVSWAIIFYKGVMIRQAMKQSAAFLDDFWKLKSFDAVAKNLDAFPRSPLATLYREGYQELMKVRKHQNAGAEEAAWLGDNVERALRRATTQETHRLEKYLNFLATTGSSAPFIGLFGTVWGIMGAFHAIGLSGNASLASVAPGISEALVATAIGLVAAIPAVIGYNHFINKVNLLCGEMDNFSQEFLNIVQRAKRGDA
jgi:biopolymer transport protein TolQ